MTTLNLKFLLLAVVVCTFCYGNARRLRSTGDIALAMDIIEREYVETPDREKLYQSAMRGMIDSLDKYSGYIPRDSFKPFQALFDQEFDGLGVILDGPPNSERLTVAGTLFDSPAFRAGVLPDDVLIEINGKDSTHWSREQASKAIRGPEGSAVALTIERAGTNEPLKIQVIRSRIEVESVLGDRRSADGRWNFVLEEDPRIAYMRIEIFGEKTTSEIAKGVNAIKDQCRGLIIDLRDNTGGLLISATDICDLFLDEGVIVSTRGRDNRLDQQYLAQSGTILPSDFPIAILINENSASASEILAACLQDHHRATLVGNRTYGKGSVQNVIPLDAGLAGMRLTTAYYYPPSERLIHRKFEDQSQLRWGVDPNEGCEVVLSTNEQSAAAKRFRLRADPRTFHSNPKTSNEPAEKVSSENSQDSDLTSSTSQVHRDPTIVDDPQLLRAVEVLQQSFGK